MNDDQPVVDIEIVTYSPVAARRPTRDFWRECIHGNDLDAPVRRLLERYVLRCYVARESDFYEVTFTTTEGTWLNDKLARMRKLPLAEGDAERCDITQEIADKLSMRMEASGAGTVPGAIFLIQAKLDGKRYIALVKVDLGRHEVVALHNTTEARHLFCKAFDGALPENTRKFRKAVLVPSPGDGDARSGQFDAFSDYWQEFVGAQPLRETARATKAILETARRIMRDEHRELTSTVVWSILERVIALKNRTVESVAKIIADTTRLANKREKIEHELQRNLGNTTLASVTQLAAHLYSFRDGELTLRVPANIVSALGVIVQQDGDDVIIRIKKSRIKREDIVEHKP